MKSIFELFSVAIVAAIILLSPAKSYSREYFLITGKPEVLEQLETIRRILKTQFHIPERLIDLRVISNECVMNKKSIMHLCYVEEMKILYLNKIVIQRAFAHWQWDE
jgi:hypothetical protein